MRRTRATRGVRDVVLARWLLATVLVLTSGLFGAGPEVVRVRVPAGDVTRYFPPGTGLRVLSPEEFEARVAASRREPAGVAAAAPRLIRARHRARWESGLLRGRTELVVGAGPSGPVEFPLDPWTPAVLVQAGTAPSVGARDSGAAVLRIAASPREQVLSIEWEQQPRPHSNGRGFALGLPAVDTTVLDLELPRGWTASSQRGVRRGPIAEKDPSSSLWVIDGESGRFDLELRDAAGRGQDGAVAGAWMSTATEVDLRRTAERTGSMINWTTEARLELDARHAAGLEVQLDPGLELIDVRGDAVQGYRTERTRDGTRAVIAIAEGTRTTTVRLLAHAAVPSSGDWPIPAVRPIDAIWTGGQTSVVLDELHVASDYRERAGRLVQGGRRDAGGGNRLTFEAGSPHSVADLVFVRPRPELTCLVRGQLILSGTPARLDCRLDWSVHRGSASQLEVDLSPGWSPDGVRILGLDDPLAWHSSPHPSGGTRLRVMVPASILTSGQWTLAIGATAGPSAAREPLDLPRVSPLGAAVVDEAWVAWGDDAATIQPVQARGLAWIDPAEVPGMVGLVPLSGLRQLLAWRWTAAAAGARIELGRGDRDPGASIRTLVRLTPDGGSLAIEGTFRVRSGDSAIGTLPVWVDVPGDPLKSWRFLGEDGERPLRPLDEASRERLGLPRGASARALVLDLPPHAERALTFRANQRWSSPIAIPLLQVPRGTLEEGTVRLETPAGMRTHLRAQGLGRLAPGPSDPQATDAPSQGLLADRAVQVFSYDDPAAHLELSAEPMEPSAMTGVVRDAFLATTWDGQGRMLHRLRLLVQLGRSPSLTLDFRAAAVVRVLQDGTVVTPTRSGDRITIPAPAIGAGARSTLIVIDYIDTRGDLGDGSILYPARPELGIPCLSFAWSLTPPPGWRALDPGAGLVAGHRDDPDRWPCGVLGLGELAWPSWWGRRPPDLEDRLRQLDGRLGRPAAAELTFAEWFSRWDSGPWPVLIDRLALGAAGLGPRSSCLPGRLAADRRESARALLRQHGLAAVAFPDALIITTESQRRRFDRQGDWLDAVAEALAWGSDRSDRFQTVAEWRGEAGLRNSSPAVASAALNRLSPNREVWWFSAPGWPGTDGYVHLVDVRGRMLMGWIVAGILGIAWLSTSRRASGRWLILPALAVAACVLLEPVLPARHRFLTAGGLVGALAILLVELGRRCRRSPSPVPPPRAESSLVRAVAGMASLLVLGLAIGSLRAAPAGPEAPIVALFPYEGTYDPARPPDRVILRLEDFRRLSPPADDQGAGQSVVTAVASGHRVVRKDGREILVESEIELAARGSGPFEWRVPVSASRDISARLGGEPVPVAIEPGGETAKVVIPGAGNYLLSLRRWASARAEAGGEVLSLPVNSTPSARLIVDPPADKVPQGLPVTKGRIERKPDGSLDGRLGPCDRIVVRWAGTGRAVPARGDGPVEALMLWDVTPAGDRVRQRLTYHRAEEIASLRLSHDPGLVLRSVRSPGESRVYVQEAGDGQWLVSFDPPLPPSALITLEAWRPAPVVVAPASGDQARQLPRMYPAEADRFTGVLGVRRPGDWTGRVEPIRDTEPIDDEVFVRSWGSLPGEPLTLCGTTRFSREPRVELRTVPAPPRVVVHPAVQLRVESGRVVIAADADIESSLLPPIMVAELPRGLHLTRVIGEGLVGWTVASDRRLRLIWERGESPPRRHVRLLGWVPIEEDPMEIRSRPFRLRTPWVGWPGAEQGTGTLTVLDGIRGEIRGGAGIATAPPPPAPSSSGAAAAAAGGSPTVAAPPRLHYVVSDPGDLGELSWDPRPLQVAVTIESRLTIDPDQAGWVAAIRYDVARGPLERINLKIPAAWAARARISGLGDGPVTPAQVIGPSAFWSIAPGRPLWGSHRLVLRSSLPVGASREVLYPEVAPLGKGAVDTYVSVVNATGHPLAAEDATGLQPIPAASRFRDPIFARVTGTSGGAYRVVEGPWALRIQVSRGAAETSGVTDDAARVAMADIAITVMPDRSTFGRALYDLKPDGGRLLNVDLPSGGTILWASAGPELAVPLHAGNTTWAIPLTSMPSGRVCLIWSVPPPQDGSRRWSLSLPRAGPEPAPVLLSASVPAGLAVDGMSASLEPASMSALEKARADRLDRSIRESVAKLDRSSGRDHERLVSLLIEHELTLRDAERSAGRDELLRGDRDFLASIAAARTAMADAIRSAGLSGDLAAAHSYLGLSSDPTTRPVGGIPEPIVPCRIRTFGRPAAMIGNLPGLDGSAPRPALAVTTDQSPQSRPLADRWILAAVAAAVVAGFLGGRRAPLASAIALALALFASAVTGGPVLLSIGLGLTAIGRAARPTLA